MGKGLAIQYIPNSCEGFTEKKQEFETIDELLNIDFVKRWTLYPTFRRFSFSLRITNRVRLRPLEGGRLKKEDNLIGSFMLMADFGRVIKWCTVAYLKGDVEQLLNKFLPEWEPPK